MLRVSKILEYSSIDISKTTSLSFQRSLNLPVPSAGGIYIFNAFNSILIFGKIKKNLLGNENIFEKDTESIEFCSYKRP